MINNQTFQGFQAEAALAWLGREIKALAKYSNLSDQEVARTYHIGTHTISAV